VTAFARHHRITLNTVIQGAFALLLAGYTGTRDICFGVISAGRPADLPDVEAMVGMFLATTPLRVTLDPQNTILDMLIGLQTHQLLTRQHEHAPLAKIQSWSPVGPGKSLFDIILAVQNYANVKDDRAEELGTEAADARDANSYSLTLSVKPGDELRFDVEYDSARFREAEISTMLKHLSRVLREVVSAPGDRLDDLILPRPRVISPSRPGADRKTASRLGA
jgi:non-ribosomal peptide synthetase component F